MLDRGVWGYVAIVLGLLFGLHGTTLGSLWYYFGITLGEWAVPSVCFVGGYYGSHYFINIRHLLTFVESGVLVMANWEAFASA